MACLGRGTASIGWRVIAAWLAWGCQPEKEAGVLRLNSCHSFTAIPSPNGTPRENTGTKGLLRRLQT